MRTRTLNATTEHSPTVPISPAYIHAPSHAVVTLRMMRCQSNFAHVETECACGQLREYTHGGPDKIQTPTHCNLIGRGMTAPPSVIAQQYSSAPASHCALITAWEKILNIII